MYLALLFLAACGSDEATDTSTFTTATGTDGGDDDDGCDPVTIYADSDGDGFGDPDRAQTTCDPADRTTNGDDCDDTDPESRPGGVEVCGDGVDQDCSGGDEVCPRTAALPVAPTAGAFQPQALHTAFVDAAGEPCTVSLTVAMGDQALCFADGASDLWCAGRIYAQTWGTSFAPAGLTGVTQVLVMPTFDAEEGNGACAVVGGEPTCLGYNNELGQLGNGTGQTTADWTPWVAGADIRWLATGTSDLFCGPDRNGAVWCTGFGVGSTPEILDTTLDESVWIDTFGELHVDESGVFRVSQGRSACGIRPEGLDCGRFLGAPGHVVDGGEIELTEPGYDEAAVWLEDDGTVYLARIEDDGAFDTTTRFRGLPVLAIAYHYYTDSVCAVYSDGSLVCFGSNAQGKLGTGNLDPLSADTVVAPPGTFDLTCR